MSIYGRFFTPSPESSGSGQRYRKKNKVDYYWNISNTWIPMFLIPVAVSLSNRFLKITTRVRITFFYFFPRRS